MLSWNHQYRWYLIWYELHKTTKLPLKDTDMNKEHSFKGRVFSDKLSCKSKAKFVDLNGHWKSAIKDHNGQVGFQKELLLQVICAKTGNVLTDMRNTGGRDKKNKIKKKKGNKIAQCCQEMKNTIFSSTHNKFACVLWLFIWQHNLQSDWRN